MINFMNKVKMYYNIGEPYLYSAIMESASDI